MAHPSLLIRQILRVTEFFFDETTQVRLKTSSGLVFYCPALYIATYVKGSQIITAAFSLCLHNIRQPGIGSIVFKHKFNSDDTEQLKESD